MYVNYVSFTVFEVTELSVTKKYVLAFLAGYEHGITKLKTSWYILISNYQTVHGPEERTRKSKNPVLIFTQPFIYV